MEAQIEEAIKEKEGMIGKVSATMLGQKVRE